LPWVEQNAKFGGINGPLKFLAEGFLVEEHIGIAKLAVEAIFDVLDGLDDVLKVRVTGEDNEGCVGLAIDASLVVEHTGWRNVFRAIRAEFLCNTLQRSGFAVFLM
jgi:hypothetical protein